MLYNAYLNLLKEDGIPLFLKKYLTLPILVRLKRIGYFCGMDYASKDIYNFKEYISRYDHSLTVALITWKFSKNKLYTIAALFHDISTPCFAHVIDYMNKDYESQESTEKYTKDILMSDKNIIKYLEEDGILIDDIINFKKYSIVDNKRPNLCADRLDGIILNGISWTKTLTKENIIQIINDIKVFLNEDQELELGFKTKEIALQVLNVSNEIDKLCHSSYDNYMMELLATITKTTINNRIIKYEELYYLDEESLFAKIKSSKIKELNELMNKFENITRAEIPLTIIPNIKVRDLNPLVNNVRLKDN